MSLGNVPLPYHMDFFLEQLTYTQTSDIKAEEVFIMHLITSGASGSCFTGFTYTMVRRMFK